MRGPIRSRRRARRSRASASSGASRAAARRCMRASSPSAEVRARIDQLLASVSRGARCAAGRASPGVRRRMARQLPLDAGGRRRARRRSGPRARRFRARRPRRHDVRARRSRALRRRQRARSGLQRGDQRSLQGRGDRAQARPAGENRHSLQIEIKRTLYMDEDTLVPNEGYARLQRDLTRLAEILAACVHTRENWSGHLTSLRRAANVPCEPRRTRARENGRRRTPQRRTPGGSP